MLVLQVLMVFVVQVILDITFYEENKLVDQEFPEEISPFKIQQLLQDLTEPEVLATRLAPSQEVQLNLTHNALPDGTIPTHCVAYVGFMIWDTPTLNLM